VSVAKLPLRDLIAMPDDLVAICLNGLYNPFSEVTALSAAPPV
jgi:hypothetical protein